MERLTTCPINLSQAYQRLIREYQNLAQKYNLCFVYYVLFSASIAKADIFYDDKSAFIFQ